MKRKVALVVALGLAIFVLFVGYRVLRSNAEWRTTSTLTGIALPEPAEFVDPANKEGYKQASDMLQAGFPSSRLGPVEGLLWMFESPPEDRSPLKHSRDTVAAKKSAALRRGVTQALEKDGFTCVESPPGSMEWLHVFTWKVSKGNRRIVATWGVVFERYVVLFWADDQKS